MNKVHKSKHKVCPICKEIFYRPLGKSDKVWKKQKCCGLDCSAISRRKDTTKRIRRKELNPGDRRFGGRTWNLMTIND